MAERYDLYKNATIAIKNHVKQIWDNLENKVEYVNFILLRGQLKSYDNGAKQNSTLQKSVYKKVQLLLKQETYLNKEALFVKNQFGTIFENYLSLVIFVNQLNEESDSNYNKILDQAYTLIATARGLIKQADAFIELIVESVIPLPEGDFIDDDKILITFESFKKTMQIESDDGNDSHNRLLFLRIFGWPTFLLAGLSIIGIIIFAINLAIKVKAQMVDIEYLKQISLEQYNQALKELISNISNKPINVFFFTLFTNLIWIGYLISFLYLIIGKTVVKKLIAKQDKSEKEKYLLAWAYIDMGIFPFSVSMEKHLLLTIELAEDGFIPALIRLGRLYETSNYLSKKQGLTQEQKLQRAMENYKRAFPNKRALKYYDHAKTKLENLN